MVAVVSSSNKYLIPTCVVRLASDSLVDIITDCVESCEKFGARRYIRGGQSIAKLFALYLFRVIRVWLLRLTVIPQLLWW